MKNSVADISAYFQSFGTETHRAVVESTTGWYWLDDLLKTLGVELVLAHAKYLKAIAYAKVKTDKVDARTLAQLLRMNYIPIAHKIRPELREVRDLTRARLRLVWKRTSCYNSIHRLGEKFNCDHLIDPDENVLPEELPLLYKEQVTCLHHQIVLLTEQIKHLEHLLNERLIDNDVIQHLLWIPAFGRITAFSVYLEIDGIERFASERQLFSYARVVPGASNSNHSRRHKSGNKDGNKYLKIAFTDAAVHAVRFYPEIRSFYQKMCRRSNEAIARTVVAKCRFSAPRSFVYLNCRGGACSYRPLYAQEQHHLSGIQRTTHTTTQSRRLAPSYHVCACFTRSAIVNRDVRGSSTPCTSCIHTSHDSSWPRLTSPDSGLGSLEKPRPLDWEVRRCAEVVSGIASHKRGATGHTLKISYASVNP